MATMCHTAWEHKGTEGQGLSACLLRACVSRLSGGRVTSGGRGLACPGLFHHPGVVGHEQFVEVVVRLLRAHGLYLLIDGSLVGGCCHVADDAQCDGEVGAVHEGELQLEGVVLAVCGRARGCPSR
mgnify:CR=1 FL=1